jgi:hypothetical protein
MSDDFKSFVGAPFVGASLRSLEKSGFSWFFKFDEPLSIATESSWRFITPERIEVTSEDHGYPFGLPQPVDAIERVMSRLSGVQVQSVSCDATTGARSVFFGEKLYLQFLQMSCGYESWRVHSKLGLSFCLGGGEIAYFPETPS